MFRAHKDQLRKTFKAAPALSVQARNEASRALCQRLLAHAWWQQAAAVAAFVGVRHEPDTTELLTAVFAAGKSLWLPRIDSGRIAWCSVTALDQLGPGTFGLLEPTPVCRGQRELPALDLILVPGVAFDRAGARLGWGKGHYDRALQDVHAHQRPRRVGLCLENRFDATADPLPMDRHDVPMHAIATEAQWVWCGGGGNTQSKMG